MNMKQNNSTIHPKGKDKLSEGKILKIILALGEDKMVDQGVKV